MSFLFGPKDPSYIEQYPLDSEGYSSASENFEITRKYFIQNEVTYSRANVLRDQWQPIIDELNAQTDAGFYNPANNLSVFASSEAGRNEFNYQAYANRVLAFIDENKNRLGKEFSDITLEKINEQARQQAIATAEQYNQITDRSSGAGSFLAQIGGGAAAFVDDPVIAGSVGLGMLGNAGRGLYGLMFREALIGAGSEVLIQPAVKEWHESLGRDYTLEQFYTAVLAAGGLGALTPLAFNVLGKGYSLTAEQAQKGIEAIRKSGYKKTSQEEIIEEIIDDIETDVADNPFNSPDVENDPTQTVHQKRLKTASIAVQNGEQPLMPFQPEVESAPRKEVSGSRSTILEFDPMDIEAEPDVFQYKAGGDIFGVTEKYKDVTVWDPEASNVAMIFEYADGKKVIADGHQRLGIAKRVLTNDPSQDVKIAARVYREVDGYTPVQVRVMAARKNIIEGSGTAIDAAKVLRERPDLEDYLAGVIGKRNPIFQQSQGLSKLADDVFISVINGTTEARFAAPVGHLIPDDELLQKTAISVLAKANPENVYQAESIVKQVKASGYEIQSQETLFGEEFFAESYYAERAKIIDRASKLIRQDKNAFASLVRNASELETEGNKLATDANRQRKDNDTKALQLIDVAANTPGQISDTLNAAAKQLRETGKSTEPVQRFIDAIRTGIRDGEFGRLSDGDLGPVIEYPKTGRPDKGEALELVEDFDDPGGPGTQRQSDQLETDLFSTEQDEILKEVDDLIGVLDKALLEGNDDLANDALSKIKASQAVQDAEMAMEQIPLTITKADDVTEEFRNNRRFTFQNADKTIDEVIGYDAAIDRLYENAKKLGWEDDGIVYPGPDVPSNIKGKNAVVIIGPPAAGKSSIANPIARWIKGTIVDSDEAKKVIPESLILEGTGYGANAVHAESGVIAAAVKANAIANGDNIVFPTVGNDFNKTKDLVQEFNGYGYKVTIVDMAVSENNFYSRAIKRWRSKGRYLPMWLLDGVGNLPSITYNKLKEQGIGDVYARIDNNGPWDQPKPRIEDQTDWLGQTDIQLRPVGDAGPGDLEQRILAEVSEQSGFDQAFESDLFLDESFEIPNLSLDEAGEIISTPKTVKEIKAEIAQDQAMLERLRGCVE